MAAARLAFPSLWRRTVGFGRLALSRQKVAGIHFGARNAASGLALRVKLQTGPQTTLAVTSTIVFGTG
jgi:hypothetical protein